MGIIASLFSRVLDITFIREDEEGMHMLHDDALVVELSIGDCMVKKVLIDNGSLTNIVFLDTLKEMRYDVRNVKEEKVIKLIGFNGKPSTVLGIVAMSVKTGNYEVYNHDGSGRTLGI